MQKPPPETFTIHSARTEELLASQVDGCRLNLTPISDISLQFVSIFYSLFVVWRRNPDLPLPRDSLLLLSDNKVFPGQRIYNPSNRF